MNPNLFTSTRARFERKSTNTWLTLKLDELIENRKEVQPLNMAEWEHIGLMYFPDFELVTIGEDIE